MTSDGIARKDCARDSVRRCPAELTRETDSNFGRQMDGGLALAVPVTVAART